MTPLQVSGSHMVGRVHTVLACRPTRVVILFPSSLPRVEDEGFALHLELSHVVRNKGSHVAVTGYHGHSKSNKSCTK